MTDQNGDSRSKDEIYREEYQNEPVERLEKELLTLKLKRTALENLDTERHQIPGEDEEDPWDDLKRMGPAERAKWLAEELDDGSDDKSIDEAYFKWQAECNEETAKLAAMDPIERALLRVERQAETGQSGRLNILAEVSLRIRVIEQVIVQKLSRPAASSAGPEGLSEPPLPNYPKSELKRKIAAVLRRKLGASDAEVCGALDSRGKVSVIRTWNRGGKYYLFASVLEDPELKQNVHSEIDRVRRDMRRLGWQIPRRIRPKLLR